MKRLLIGMTLVAIGFLTGAFVFTGTQARSIAAVANCGDSCYRMNDLVGLMASAAIRHTPGWLPKVVKESPRCVTIEHPVPSGRLHFVSFPKRDIKDVADISGDDQAYVMECLAHARELVKQHELRAYKVLTNGPAYQHLTYLHFHLIAN